MLFFAIIAAVSLYTVFFWNMYTRYAYSLSFLAVIIIGTHYSKKLSGSKKYFYVCENIISLLSFLATLLLTDLQFIGSVPYLLIAVTAAFLPIGESKYWRYYLKSLLMVHPKAIRSNVFLKRAMMVDRAIAEKLLAVINMANKTVAYIGRMD